MYLRFVDHQLAPSTDFDARASDIYSRTRSLPEGMPILLDDRWRPVEPWLTYFRIVAASTDPATLRAYAYDARRFASFLATRQTDVIHASSDDIVAFREWRLSGSERPESPATCLLLLGGESRVPAPWITPRRRHCDLLAERSVVSPSPQKSPAPAEPAVRSHGRADLASRRCRSSLVLRCARSAPRPFSPSAA